VFIEETAVSTNLARLRGRAPKGVRVIGTVPLGTWETITFVVTLCHNKMTAPRVIDTNSRSNRTSDIWERRHGFNQLWVAFDIEEPSTSIAQTSSIDLAA
jgi:hypothetical protein